MNVHWHRVVALALILAVVILAIVFWPKLGGVLSTVRSVGDRYADPEDRTFGLLILGVLVLSTLVALRIIMLSGGRDQ